MEKKIGDIAERETSLKSRVVKTKTNHYILGGGEIQSKHIFQIRNGE